MSRISGSSRDRPRHQLRVARTSTIWATAAIADVSTCGDVIRQPNAVHRSLQQNAISSVNLLGILLGHRRCGKRASRHAIAPADVPYVQRREQMTKCGTESLG